jgi:hypothetical protein
LRWALATNLDRRQGATLHGMEEFTCGETEALVTVSALLQAFVRVPANEAVMATEAPHRMFMPELLSPGLDTVVSTVLDLYSFKKIQDDSRSVPYARWTRLVDDWLRFRLR